MPPWPSPLARIRRGRPVTPGGRPALPGPPRRGRATAAGCPQIPARNTRLRFYGLAALAYAAFGSLFQVFPPFLTALQREFVIGQVPASLTMTAFLVPLALFSLPLGAAVDRRGPRRVGLLGFAVLLGGAGLTAAASSLPLLLAGRVVAGAGGAMALLAVLRVLTARVPAASLGTAFGLFIAGLPIGTGFDFDVLNHLGSWRLATIAAMGTAVAAAAVFWWLAPRGAPPAPQPAIRTILAHPVLRRVSLLVAVGYTAILAFTTWSPTKLTAYGHLAAGSAALITSVALLVDIPFSPLWGLVSDRLGRRKPFVAGAFLIFGVPAFAIPAAAPLGLGVLLLIVAGMGVGCAMFFPVVLTLPRPLVGEDQVGAAYGLFLTAQALGMAVGPLAVGFVFTGASIVLGFVTIGALMAAGFLVALPLRAR